MTEQEFQNEVISIADKNGWLSFHHSYEDGPVRSGWPDLVLVHPRRKLLLFRELKRESGPIKCEQSEFLYALQAVGADAKVWRPSDWNEIVEVLEDESDDTQEAQEVQEAFEKAYFEKAYNEALYDVYDEKGIFKVASGQSMQSSQRRPQRPRPHEEAFYAEEAIKQEAFNNAYKAIKAKEVFNKAFQDYEIEKEVREANKAYEAFNKAYEAFNKAEDYKAAKAAKAAKEKAKATEKAADKVFEQAKEKADKIKKEADKAKEKAGEASKKRNNTYEVLKKTREAFDTSEQPLSAAFSAQEAYCQAKKAHNIKAAEADKAEKAFYQVKEKANAAEKAFYQAKEKADNAASRTRKARKATEKAAADAGLHIEIVFNWIGEGRLLPTW